MIAGQQIPGRVYTHSGPCDVRDGDTENWRPNKLKGTNTEIRG